MRSPCDLCFISSQCFGKGDEFTYAIDGGIIGEANVTPTLSLRLAGDYYGTGFGSTMQNSFGFTYGFVYRFGKQ